MVHKLLRPKPGKVGKNWADCGISTSPSILEADREGDAVIVRPLAERSARRNERIVDSLPVLEGRLSDPAMTFHR